MKYLSLFSGIEAATVAWHPLGWHCVAVAEIEPFPCSVLAHHYPHVPNLGDVTLVDEERIALLGPIDLVVFGSPCQDLSVAGKRKGFADGTRSSLFFTALDIIGWAREHCGCRFALWENVPGAFSSNAGRDFAAVVGNLAGLEHVDVPANGWGSEGAALGDAGLVEWSTLDAQWFGVAQRRRRVFAFADFGDWASRAPVLLEPDRLRGDSAPSRQAREDVAGAIATRIDRGGVNSEGNDGHLVASTGNVAHCLNAGGMKRIDYESGTMVAFSAKDYGADAGEVSPTLRSGGHSGSHANGGVMPAIAFHWSAQPDQMKFDEHTSSAHMVATAIQAGALRTNPAAGPDGVGVQEGVAYTLEARAEVQAAQFGRAVRRLTPTECERLQGFPDGYTLVPLPRAIRKQRKNEPDAHYAEYLAKQPMAKDGPRYKALGNSMAVPVMRHIGEQIVMAVL